MNPRYPNLELIEYKFSQELNAEPQYRKRAEKHKAQHKFFHPHFTVQVFPQIWGSTCTGFDMTDNGHATIGGCAMTEEYTTVIHESVTDIYGVFFGSLPCYIVDNPTQDFFEDLHNRQMASKSEARERYNPQLHLEREPF